MMSRYGTSKTSITCPFSANMFRDEMRDKQVYDMVADDNGILCIIVT